MGNDRQDVPHVARQVAASGGGSQSLELAPLYRAPCEAAGITRTWLFEKKANKLKLRAHDMRAFFVTAWMFAGKDAPLDHRPQRATTLGMLRTYERDVRRWRELGEAPFDAAQVFGSAREGT